MMGGRLTAFIAGMGIAMFAVKGAGAFELSAGIKGGCEWVTLTGKDATPGDDWEKGYAGRFTGGAVFIVTLSKMFGIEADLLYSTKGMNAEDTSQTSEISKSYSYSYIDVPLLARLVFTPQAGIPIRQSFLFGPFVGFLLSAEKKISGTGTFLDGTKDLEDGSKHLNAGLIFSWATEILVGPGAIIIDLRYSKGFTTVDRLTDEEKARGETEAKDKKTAAIGLMAGYVVTL